MVRKLYVIEAAVWLLAAAVAGLVLLGTLGADFPARSRSLVWESALLVMAALLVGAALWRLLRGRALLQPAGTQLGVWAGARSVLRMLLLLPWAFTLLVAAAGFAA